MYPAREDPGRWRAVWYEEGERQQCEAASEEKLAARLEKVKVRLEADAPDMKRPGADLIAYYLDPDRLPVDERWSRKHAHTQRRLCERFAAPVINAVTCQDIKTGHSLRHVFCTTALFTWKLDATDVSRMAGHANYRITLDMYVGSTAGVLDRARTATE